MDMNPEVPLEALPLPVQFRILLGAERLLFEEEQEEKAI